MGDRLIIKQINKRYNSEKAIQNVLGYIVRDKDMQGEQEIRYWKASGAARKISNKCAGNSLKFRNWREKTAGKEYGIL